MYVPAWPLPGKGNITHPRKPTMRNFSVTTDISTAKIDRGGYKRKATDSFKRVHDTPRQRQGNLIVSILKTVPRNITLGTK
jgi:hypothetical protein